MLETTQKARIHLRPGTTWSNLPPSRVAHMVDLDRLTDKLTVLVDEWYEAAAGQPLNEINVNLALILTDFCDVLGVYDPIEVTKILEPQQVAQ